MSAHNLFSKANEAFVSEDYSTAADLYTQAIRTDPDNADYYTCRAHALLKLDRYTDAKADACCAIEKGSNSSKAYLRKGMACFHLGHYQEAKEAFTEGQKLDTSDSGFRQWIVWCDDKIDKLKANTSVTVNQSRQATVTESSSSEPSKNAKETQSSEPSKNTVIAHSPESLKNADLSEQKLSASQPVEMPVPKIKHDWYQTETHVIVTVLIKNLKKDDVLVDFTDLTLSVTGRLPTGSDYSLELDLFQPIVPAQSTFKVLSSKIEIKMKKKDGLRWPNLEGDGTAPCAKSVTSVPETAPVNHPPSYPSSAAKKRDWDRIAVDLKKEEATDKEEGEAALNSLFQKIYSDGSDDVKKAMNKSFQESGGTVLSTNWAEVGKEKVEIKAPEGMEWKKWSH